MALVAIAAGAISQGMSCVHGDHAACMFAIGQVVAGTRLSLLLRLPSRSPRRRRSPRSAPPANTVTTNAMVPGNLSLEGGGPLPAVSACNKGDAIASTTGALES